MKIKTTETDLKNIVKDYLIIKGIFSYPLMQGLGCKPGLPDRVMHYKGRVHYLEIKTPKGKLSPNQLEFQEQCRQGRIKYHVIRSLEDIQEIVEG